MAPNECRSSWSENFFEHAVDLMCVADLDGRLVRVNPAWERALGWTPAELTGRPYLDFVHPDDVAETRREAEALKRGETVLRFTNRYRRKGGGWRRLEWCSTVTPGERLAYATVRDVTDAARDRAHLAEIESATGVGRWELDAETGAVWWSPLTYAIHGLDPDAFRPGIDDALAFYTPEARARLEPALAQLQATGAPYDLRLPFIDSQGRHRRVRATGRAEMAGGRVARVFGAFEDVTAEHARGEALRRASAVAERAASAAVFTGPEGRIEWANRAFEAITGYGLAEALGRKPGDFLQCEGTDPETVAAIGRALAAGEGIAVEILNRSKAGRDYWVALDIQPVRGEDGGLTGFVAIETDITARRERQRAVARANARLAATLAAIPDPIYEFDGDRRRIAAPLEGTAQTGPLDPEIEAAFRAAFDDIDARGRSAGRTVRVGTGGLARWWEITGARREPEADGAAPGYLLLTREITDRVLAQEALRHREAVLRALFDLAPIGLALNDPRTGAFLDANDAFLAPTGYSRAEILAMRYSDLTPPEWAGADAAALAELLETGRTRPFEKEYVSKDGGRYPVLLSAVLARHPEGRDHAWSFVEDISERRRFEAERDDERRFLASVLDASAAPVLVVSPEDRIVFASAEAERLLGLSREPGGGYAASAWRTLALDGAPMPEAERAHVRARATGEPERDVRCRLEWPDGRRRVVSVSAAPLGVAGGAVVVAFADMTDLHEAAEALEAARARAEAANEAKSTFLATMSHEIRTPMNGVVAMADMLSRRVVDPEQARMIAIIRESGEALTTVLNDVLDFSKIEAGRMELETAPFDPRDLLRRAESLHRPRAEEKGLGFRIEAAFDGGGRREGDAHRILQILHNLLSNAIKFTERGAVTLRFACVPDALEIAVSDQGCGMTPEQARRVREPFAQAEASTSRRHGGTGLGLAIVSRLAALMGGALEIDSAPGAGTTMRVRLPLPDAAEARAGAEGPPGRAALPPGLRVIAADDNEINRTVLAALLDALGVAHRIAPDGEGALALAAEGRADALLLDISMPGMDGVETLAAIRAVERAAARPPVPALAVTANAMTHQIAAYLAAGFAAHVAKPLTLDSLSEALAAATRPIEAAAE